MTCTWGTSARNQPIVSYFVSAEHTWLPERRKPGRSLARKANPWDPGTLNISQVAPGTVLNLKGAVHTSKSTMSSYVIVWLLSSEFPARRCSSKEY